MGGKVQSPESRVQSPGSRVQGPVQLLGYDRALKDLTRNKNIVLKKADKGTATVKINRQDKIEEGQSLLDDRNKYRPLVEPTIESTSQKVQQLVKSLSPEGHIDSMTEKWLSHLNR